MQKPECPHGSKANGKLPSNKGHWNKIEDLSQPEITYLRWNDVPSCLHGLVESEPSWELRLRDLCFLSASICQRAIDCTGPVFWDFKKLKLRDNPLKKKKKT